MILNALDLFEYEETDEGIVITKCKDQNLDKVVDLDGVVKIDQFAFDDMKNLVEVVLPNGMDIIGFSAFSGCEKLSKIVLPDTVTTISSHAFTRCPSLANETDRFVVPESVEEIGYFALPYVPLEFVETSHWFRIDWETRKSIFMGKISSKQLEDPFKARDCYAKFKKDIWKRDWLKDIK